MDKTQCWNCKFWKPLNDPLCFSTGEVMDSEPTDGMCDKHNEKRSNIEYCDDYKPK
ncbi:MAG: hypothetical protein ISS77_05525 [Phycisphaerae bacterium]|nr:hypothetical protein [Phycisphaerae bacterium]